MAYRQVRPWLLFINPVIDQTHQKYRGICVSSCLGKLFCSILNTRLQAFLKNKKMLHSSQIGFLPGNRTADHIFSLHTLIDKYVMNTTQGKLYCCLVDFRKVFDSIWLPGLLKKLLNYKIGGQFCLISTMYSKTLCCIKSGNMGSAYFKYNSGVHQGCILSPLLFNFNLNDLPLILQNTNGLHLITLPNGSSLNSLFYADDLNWFLPVPVVSKNVLTLCNNSVKIGWCQ